MAAGLLMAISSAGCGGSKAAPPGETLHPRFLYTADFDGTVSSYAYDPATGTLRAAGSVPAGTRPWALVVDGKARFAYVANSGSNDVSGFAIDPATGELTPLPGSPFAAGVQPMALAIAPSGGFLHVAHASGAIRSYAIDTASGALTASGSATAAGTSMSGGNLGVSGRFLFVANGDTNNVSAFQVDATTGALTPVPGSPFAAGMRPKAVRVHPDGKHVYVANNGGSVSAYTLDATTGALAPVTGSPFAAGTAGLWNAVIDPTGRWLYCGNSGATAETFGFEIQAGTGALVPLPGSPFRGDGGPADGVFDPSGRLLFTVDGEWATLSIFAVQPNGALTPVRSHLTRDSLAVAMTTGPVPVTYAARRAYVGKGGTSDVSTWAVNAMTGALDLLGTTAATSAIPVSLATDRLGRYLYTASGGAAVMQYGLGVGGLPAPLTPSWVAAKANTSSVAVDPSSRFAYVTNSGGGAVSQFTIGADGTLAPMSPAAVAAGTGPLSLALSPSGRHAFVTSQGASAGVTPYSIDPASGALTALTTSPVAAGQDPVAAAVHPTGRYVYVANWTSLGTTGTVSQFAVTWAGLAPLAAASVTTGGANPIAVAVDPSGRFAYAANANGHSIAQFTVEPGGTLKPMTPATVECAGGPHGLHVEGSGRFLYVPTTWGDGVARFAIGADGALSPLAPIATGAASGPVSVTTVGGYR